MAKAERDGTSAGLFTTRYDETHGLNARQMSPTSEKATQMVITSVIEKNPMVKLLILCAALLCRPIVRLIALAVGDIAHVARSLSGAAIPIAHISWQRHALLNLEAVPQYPGSQLQPIMLQ